MGLDTKALMAAQFEPRTATLEVRGLAPFYPQGEKPEWTVRGLGLAEYQRVLDAERRNDAVKAAADALAAEVSDPEALKVLLGLSATKQPQEVIKRLELLVAGSVAPQLGHDVAVKFASAFPVDFYLLTNTILTLTGLGYEPGKRLPSGDVPTSAP